jgi:hypothetical protein
MPSVSSPLFEQIANILVDPADGQPVNVRDGNFDRANSGRRFEINDGIPNFFVPTHRSADDHDRHSDRQRLL